MWFKMGMDILNSSVVRELSRPIIRRDTGQIFRRMAFIDLLSVTAEDQANDIQDASDLARLVDTTPKQAQVVWDILIKHGVLRQGPMGYSAREWMIERGILGDINKGRRPPEQPQGQQQTGQYPPHNPYQKRDSNDFG